MSKKNGLSPEEKIRQQNRIRQLAYKAREKMPKDYDSFMLVAAHLLKNAHRYYKNEDLQREVAPPLKTEVKIQIDSEMNCILVRNVKMLA